MIRLAQSDDRAAVEAIVQEAYAAYIDRIGKPPGPMLDDYDALIAADHVNVLTQNGTVVALIVLLPNPDHLLLDNIAVRQSHQGRGIGRRLIAFAESEARRAGYRQIRLYTHVTMTENIALYTRLGFAETGRAPANGYDRVFMTKIL